MLKSIKLLISLKIFITAFTAINFIILPNFALVSFAAAPQCGPTIPTGDGCSVGFRRAILGEGCDGLCIAGVKEPTVFQPNPDSFNVETQSGGSGSTVKIPDVTPIRTITKQKGGYETFLKIPCQPIFGGTCPKAEAGPAQYITRLYQFGLMIAGFLAFGAIVFGSLQYILSAGNISSTKEALETIRAAIFGLLLLLSAYLILYTINPKLVNLANPSVVPLQIDQTTPQAETGATETQQQNNPYAISTEAHPLCQSGVNTGVTVNTNTGFGGIKRTKINEKGEVETVQEIKSKEIPQASFFCLQCKTNATKSSIGECACNEGYAQSGNQCVKETKK